ncbi:MAG: OmpA family protein [Tannerella sp.]|nr:OmpA family protein [Tannerella sp.]
MKCLKNLFVKRNLGWNLLFKFRSSGLVVLMCCLSGVMTAQYDTFDDTRDQQNHWFVGIGAGPRVYIADHARQLGLSDRISGGMDLYIGKWWSPLIGTRVGASWQVLRGATKYSKSAIISGVHNPSHSIDNNLYIENPHYLYRQQFTAYQLYTDLMLNVSTLFGGENQNRFWTLVPFIGVGYVSAWEPSSHEFAMNVGLLNTLRVGENVDLIFDIRGAAFKDRFKNPVYDPNADRTILTDRLNNDTGERPYDGIPSFNIGVQFRFGGGGKQKPVYYPAATYMEIPVVEPVVEKEREVVTVWKDIASDVLILFQINQSTLLKDARVQLGFLAKLMNEYPESRYTITGYADRGTGNPDLNYRLSMARAQRAKDCLVDEFGISPTRLITVAAGGVDNQYYNDPSLSRSVVIRPDKY